jgi:hypothetical protein
LVNGARGVVVSVSVRVHACACDKGLVNWARSSVVRVRVCGMLRFTLICCAFPPCLLESECGLLRVGLSNMRTHSGWLLPCGGQERAQGGSYLPPLDTSVMVLSIFFLRVSRHRLHLSSRRCYRYPTLYSHTTHIHATHIHTTHIHLSLSFAHSPNFTTFSPSSSFTPRLTSLLHPPLARLES